MDPTQTLLDAIATARTGMYPYQELDALATWLNRGGFMPNLASVKAAEIQEWFSGRIGGQTVDRAHTVTLAKLRQHAIQSRHHG